MFFKMGVLKNFAKHLCWSLIQVFSCEICEIFKITYFTEHLRWLLLKLHITQTRQDTFCLQYPHSPLIYNILCLKIQLHFAQQKKNVYFRNLSVMSYKRKLSSRRYFFVTNFILSLSYHFRSIPPENIMKPLVERSH